MRSGGLGDVKRTFQVRMRRALSGIDVNVCDRVRLGDHDTVNWSKRNSDDVVEGMSNATG